tara:strand:- start:293 stop:946 length:654 start_codon:yes stop_codon:yes gene_type:complete
MNYDNFAQPWSAQQQQQTRIPIKGNDKYFMAHNPENWELRVFDKYNTEDGKRKRYTVAVLLPVLSSIPEVAGVNGTKAVGNHLDSGLMRTTLRDNGWTILDAGKHDYLRIYPAIKGKYHTSKWIRLERVGKRIIEHFDKEGYDEWRLQLMQTGVIDTPHPQIASLRLISMDRAMNRLERDQHIPEVANRLKSKQTQYKHTKAAIKRIEELGKDAYVF